MTAAQTAPDDEPTDPDGTLLRLVRVAGTSTDREAEFTAFMTDALPALSRTAWLLCGNQHQAEELVQQALMRTYQSWAVARRRDPLAYARKSLANQRIDTWRRRRREVLVAPADLPEGGSDPVTDQHADRDQLVRALATLSPRQRRVVVLRHLEGLSEREVAEDLGVSLGTVKSTASRGLAQLRAELGRPDLTSTDHDTTTPTRSGS
ncbi:SigE family RNA polymerase sigma factor [Oerskovia jenensis]|uniref:SigE family RNA polymerase sigma factor n=1 Tax=Oerskovia jenensis TaxID=162169 RepID=UPI0036DB13FE